MRAFSWGSRSIDKINVCLRLAKSCPQASTHRFLIYRVIDFADKEVKNIQKGIMVPDVRTIDCKKYYIIRVIYQFVDVNKMMKHKNFRKVSLFNFELSTVIFRSCVLKFKGSLYIYIYIFATHIHTQMIYNTLLFNKCVTYKNIHMSISKLKTLFPNNLSSSF